MRRVFSDKKVFKGVMPFIGFIRGQLAEKKARALASELPFDEVAVLRDNAAYLAQKLGLESVEVSPISECTDKKGVEGCQPGTPFTQFA